MNDRVKELMNDLLHMRKRLKKEEESRRTFQEMARKKDEELKKIRSDITQAEQCFKDEEAAKLRERQIVQQRDNKIKAVEERLHKTQYENELLIKRL